MSWKETLRSDPVMARLLEEHGEVELAPASNPFRRLSVSIINQQLSSASAAAVRERVFDEFENGVTPEAMLSADEDALRAAGLSHSKISYLQNAAEAFLHRDLTPSGLEGHSDTEVIEELTTIKGVGEWTARMYLLFVLGREDVLPLGDLGIRQGLQDLYADGDDLTRAEMREIATPWRPYRSYGTLYVWREYEADTEV
jgi:DNA-3-methyladenine glycosylase II